MTDMERGSLADRLFEVAYLESEVQRLRDVAFTRERDARTYRAQADAIELEIVEQRAAANILREVGLRVDRTPDGTPRVTVDRTIEAAKEHTDG